MYNIRGGEDGEGEWKERVVILSFLLALDVRLCSDRY